MRLIGNDRIVLPFLFMKYYVFLCDKNADPVAINK